MVTKDYYRILRVLPDAEDAVIRAAYKALAFLYHPDRKPTGSKTDHERMALINEAFEILSDAQKRSEYDARLNVDKDRRSSDYGESDSDPIPTTDPFLRDWEVACNYYPDLAEIAASLSKLSWQLTLTFKGYLLESKSFDRRLDVANGLRTQFLQLYFGNNKRIKTLARSLIEANNFGAAKTLNQAVRVLGPDADSTVVINRLKQKYPEIIEPPNSSAERAITQFASLRQEPWQSYQASKDWIEYYGGNISIHEGFWKRNFIIVLDGISFDVPYRDLPNWISSHLIPKLKA